MITSNVSLTSDGGGRLEYVMDGSISDKEKLQLWENLCNAVKNFYENNEELLNKK